MQFISSIDSGSALLEKIGKGLQSPLLLAIRLVWGWGFFETGFGKLSNHAKTVEFFTGLGLPLPGFNAWIAGGAECVCGLLLLAGLASRAASLPLIATMSVAYLTAHADTLHAIFDDPDAFTSAPPFLYLLSATMVLGFGPGAFSADRILKRIFEANAAKTL